MIPLPEEAPGSKRAGGSGLPGVQLEQEGSEVPSAWLADPAFDRPNADVDRLAGDLDLYNTLALSGFSGADYDYFADELARYGLAVIGAWVRSGLIYSKCRDRGFGGLPSPERELDIDDVESITNETVGRAVVKFRETVLLTRRWDPSRGASLRTFFIGQCLIRFANVYRGWFAEQTRNQPTDELLEGQHPLVRPHDRAVDGMVAQDELASIRDPRLKRALVWTAAGWQQSEIARELDVSEKTVERMLGNHRQRIRRRSA